MYGCLSCSRFRRCTCQRACPARGGVRVPGSLPRRDEAAYRVGPAGLPTLVHRPRTRSARGGAGGHRAVRALVAGRAPRSALDGVAPAVGGGRLLPRLCHRPDSAALAGRLRPSPDGASRVAHPRSRSSAVRSPDYHRPAVAEPERLRPGRFPRPARAADLRSVRGQHRRPERGTRPPGTTRAR